MASPRKPKLDFNRSLADQFVTLVSGATLDLSNCALSTIKATVIQDLPKIPANVTILQLAWNELASTCSADELAKILAAIPNTVTCLGLSGNALEKLTGAGLAQALKGIRDGVSTLSLARNQLGTLKSGQLAIAFKGLSRDLQALSLNENDLGALPVEELVAAFSALPKNLKTLQLSNNNLKKLPATALAKALAVIPKGVTIVVLDDNGLDNITAADTVEILSKLPDTVVRLTGITLNYASINEAYERLLKLTRDYSVSVQLTAEYFDSIYGVDRNNSMLAKKKVNFFNGLITKLEEAKEEKDKYKAMKAFVSLLNGKNKDNAFLNEHRDHWCKRYLANVLSVLMIIPALYRAWQSHKNFGTLCFWRPDSEKLKGVALEQGEAMKIASLGG